MLASVSVCVCLRMQAQSQGVRNVLLWTCNVVVSDIRMLFIEC